MEPISVLVYHVLPLLQLQLLFLGLSHVWGDVLALSLLLSHLANCFILSFFYGSYRLNSSHVSVFALAIFPMEHLRVDLLMKSSLYFVHNNKLITVLMFEKVGVTIFELTSCSQDH